MPLCKRREPTAPPVEALKWKGETENGTIQRAGATSDKSSTGTVQSPLLLRKREAKSSKSDLHVPTPLAVPSEVCETTSQPSEAHTSPVTLSVQAESSSAVCDVRVSSDGDGPSPLANALLDQLIKLEANQREQRLREQKVDDDDFTRVASASLGSGARKSAQSSGTPQLDFMNHSTRTSNANGSLHNLLGIASILSTANTFLMGSPDDEGSHISPPLDCLLRMRCLFANGVNRQHHPLRR